MPTFELKGTMTPLTVLRLLSTDTASIEDELRTKINQSPAFFRDTPLLVDMTALKNRQGVVNMPALVQLLRESGLAPVGLKSGDSKQKAIAATLQLGIFPETRPLNKHGGNETEKSAPPAHDSSPMLIKQKVRSGQRVHARGRDLIVLGSVSNGAEIIADGHIHVYGTLYGRAMAGGRDNVNARIFCHSLEAELVSVAGNYQIHDDLDTNLRGKQVQIFLKDKKQLVIEQL